MNLLLLWFAVLWFDLSSSEHHHHHHHHLHHHDHVSVDSHEFRDNARQTYQQVLPCIHRAWMMDGKSSEEWKFPDDAEKHFEELKNITAKFRTSPIHEYAGYSGPWIENIFISHFMDKPLAYFNGFIPLFIQWIDTQILGNKYFRYMHYELGHALRPDVLYLAISQGDVGLGFIGTNHPNVLVLSAGGFGHVPIPLIKGELSMIERPERYDKDIGFVGNAKQATRSSMFEIISKQAKNHSLSFYQTQGNNWVYLMNNTKYNLAPRGYGRSSFRYSEIIQLGRIPVFLYDDYPWIPYAGTNISIDHYGFSAGLFDHSLETMDLGKKLANVSQEELDHLHDQLAQARYYFTYQGVIEQIDRFIGDPFGEEGGFLRCTNHPRTERCCDPQTF